MRTFGLISRIVVDHWGTDADALPSYETVRIVRAARDCYDDVRLLNPRLAAVVLDRGATAPRVIHAGEALPRVDTLMVRGTATLGDGLFALAHAVALAGADVLDPLDRMEGTGGSKLLTTFTRFAAGVGSTSALAFSRQGADALVAELHAEGRMPLVAKPVAGRGGHGVVVLRDPAEAARHLDALYGADPAATLLVQAAERFVAEYRVMVCFGAVLGVARKLPREGAVAANAAQGGVFAPAERPDVAAFVAAHADPVGILGVDVGEVDDGSLRLIEANRAPQWQAFDAALGIDTAREIVRHARQRLADPVHVPAGPERA